MAARFVQETGVDLLAVSVGNVHVLIKGEQDLDLDRLSQICSKVAKPLVLHGGTGISATSLREAIALGVTKVNYGTYLKQRYLSAVRTSVAADLDNPHELLGMGGDRDVMVAGRIGGARCRSGADRFTWLLRKGEMTMVRIGCAGILVKDTFCGPLKALPGPGELVAIEAYQNEGRRMRSECRDRSAETKPGR